MVKQTLWLTFNICVTIIMGQTVSIVSKSKRLIYYIDLKI